MTRENSPNYALGCADAREDMRRVAKHGGVAVGPQVSKLRDPGRPTMYLRGYEETYRPVEHRCTAACPGNQHARS